MVREKERSGEGVRVAIRVDESVSDLFWPGDHRAGDLMSGPAFLAALVDVERGWLSALVSAGIAPATAADDLADLVDPDDAPDLSTAAESGGNPVIPLVSKLRERVGNPEAVRWLHRGLTSQDAVDTALVLCAADTGARRARTSSMRPRPSTSGSAGVRPPS